MVFRNPLAACPDAPARSASHPSRAGIDSAMFNIWVSVALLGLWSCVGVMYNNSRKASRQLDEIVLLLREIAAKK